MPEETYEFCRIIDLLEYKAQILYIVNQRDEDDLYVLETSCYFPGLGQISLTFAGWNERKDAVESMHNQTIDNALELYEKFKSISNGNVDLDILFN